MMKIFDRILNKVRSKDELSDRGYSLFHYNGDIKSRTLLGGLGTLFIQIYVSYIACKKGIQMFGRQGPEILSIYSGLTSEDDSKFKIVDFIQPLLHIWEGGTENPLTTVELDRESRRYMKVRINNVHLTFRNNTEFREHKYYPLQKCPQSYFNTPFEKSYFNRYIVTEHVYCAMDEKIIL